MIARTWTGTVHRADAEEYAEYVRETGFAEYGQTPGHLSAWLLRHDDGDRTEFITLSLWDSVDESMVTHYQVVDQVQPAPGQAREPQDEER